MGEGSIEGKGDMTGGGRKTEALASTDTSFPRAPCQSVTQELHFPQGHSAGGASTSHHQRGAAKQTTDSRCNEAV